ncbi:diacylglycerol kinase family protein [Bacillus sp. B15-48]|uniref:diacylglycerol/lipid kinase family protein n=1 Tax=Bacillus sp. B15-48 TaxID=1548601 RepID=UPI00193F7C6A|nr:diacylglycerol kinase family protein [Bacillus sp. B15-48]MBM4762610.1 YegS/Rv2252/BmrU family lipid kinase [Bacillus sp. B15-48]
MKQVYFIVNRQAKNGQCRKIWGKVEKQLKKENVSYHAFYTEYSGHATKLVESIVKEIGETPCLIIGIGGDGTIHEIVNGSVGKENVSIAFIPGGSGNDYARGFHIPKEIKAALNLIFDQPFVKKIDVGKVHNREGKDIYFVNSMGAGFDAAICEEANQSKLKAKLNLFSLGSLAYVTILIKKLFQHICVDMVLSIDGLEYEFRNVWFITVSNQVYYGGGMKIAPDANPTDGLLNITVVHNLSKWKLLFVFITVFWGGHRKFKEVNTYTGRNVSIQSDHPFPIHADGEVIGTTPVQVQVCEKSLTIIAGA